MKKISLSEFIEFLDGLKHKDFDETTVENYLVHRHLDSEELAPFIYFHESTYGRNLVARESIYLEDDIGIHSISNLSSKPAVSLHLYLGPIRQCRVYDEATSQFHW